LTDTRQSRADNFARTLKEASLTTCNVRAKLPAGLHWRGIDPEPRLGYAYSSFPLRRRRERLM